MNQLLLAPWVCWVSKFYLEKTALGKLCFFLTLLCFLAWWLKFLTYKCVYTFPNSLIIHEEKTKEITTVKEVGICDPNYHKIREVLLWFSPRIINALRSYIKHLKECFIRYPNTSKMVQKNSAAPRFFNPPLSVWISDETLFLVFDILLQNI